MVTDPYRYLPCALHEALEIPWDVPWCRWRPDGPKEQIGPQSFVQVVVSDIDLAHPAGWDHAVRAYAIIRGVTIPESACCRFAWTDAAEGWSVDIEYGEDVPGRMVHLTNPNAWDTPAGRREALCRCICAALGLDVGAVFPVERA